MIDLAIKTLITMYYVAEQSCPSYVSMQKPGRF